MKDEREIRERKSHLLTHIGYCNKEISNYLKAINEQKTELHDCEAQLKIIKEVLED